MSDLQSATEKFLGVVRYFYISVCNIMTHSCQKYDLVTQTVKTFVPTQQIDSDETDSESDYNSQLQCGLR